MTDETASHDDVEASLQESMPWPQYFVCGEGTDAEGFVPAYYRVAGPNGPVSYRNPNSGPYPTTMYGFAMEAKGESFRPCSRDETPWGEDDA